MATHPFNNSRDAAVQPVLDDDAIACEVCLRLGCQIALMTKRIAAVAIVRELAVGRVEPEVVLALDAPDEKGDEDRMFGTRYLDTTIYEESSTAPRATEASSMRRKAC